MHNFKIFFCYISIYLKWKFFSFGLGPSIFKLSDVFFVSICMNLFTSNFYIFLEIYSHAVSYIRWHYQKQNFLNFILCSPTPALYAMIFVFCDISSLAYFHLLFHFVTSNLILWENESRILSKPCTVAFYLSQNKIRKK